MNARWMADDGLWFPMDARWVPNGCLMDGRWKMADGTKINDRTHRAPIGHQFAAF
jgi:hypothetical protein